MLHLATELMNCPISVLLVDDHPLLRKCLEKELEDDPDLVVVGTAENGSEAVKLVQELAPQVVVMDLAMPVMDGIQATRLILRHTPHPAILMLSVNDDEDCIRQAYEAGADRFVLKNALDFDLAGAIKTLAEVRRQ